MTALEQKQQLTCRACCAQRVQLLHEPSAAALAYADSGLQAAPRPRNVLVRSLFNAH